MENLLSKFIKEYIAENFMTIADLAKKMDVPHSTVARWVREDTTPSITQLAKLARATSTDICTLVYMVAPGERREPSVDARQLAERITKLPEDGQKLVEAMLMAVAFQDRNETGHQ